MAEISIRFARADDADAVCVIYNQGIEDRIATLETDLRSPEERRHWLAMRGPRHPVIVAEHDGYQRLADPVTHRRTIVYDSAVRSLIVTDNLECSGTHWVELFWHFAPDCALSLESAAATVECAAVGLQMRWRADLRAEVVRGDTQAPLGWCSAQYDDKTPSSTLVLSGQISGSWCTTTKIQIEFAK